jgi:hypothetical protein
VVVWGWRGVELGVSTGCGRLDGARPPASGARVATYDGASVPSGARIINFYTSDIVGLSAVDG